MKSFLSSVDAHIYKQVIENSFDSSWVISLPQYQLEFANKRPTERLLGYPIEHFYADSNFWSKIVYPDDREIAFANTQKCIQEHSAEARYRMVRSDGEVIWVHVRLCLIQGAEGNPLRMIGTSMDVTDAFLNEQKLRQSNELFESLTAFSPIGIYKSDKYGNCIFVNDTWLEIYGNSMEEVQGSGWSKTIHPDDIEAVSAEWGAAMREKRQFQKDFRVLNPKKGIRYVSSRAAPIFGHDGQTIGYVGSVEDVTERITVEKTLVSQREKLIASSKMSSLGEMASGIAHEINNPLMIIIGMCTKLSRLISSGNSEPVVLLKELGKIEGTAFRISKIIKGLKAFSRNSEYDQKESLTVQRLIEETLELCRQRFADNSINLRVHLDDCADAELLARPSQLNQVLLNLLSNAFDAVEGREERWVELRASHVGEHVYFSVTDSGPGIPAEIAGKIMNPFFTTKEVGKGTGLGLSISQGIIEDHHGKIFLDPNSAHTRFVVQLKKNLY